MQPCLLVLCRNLVFLHPVFAAAQTARIPDAALLHVNYANLVEGLLPYSVAIDEAQRCVVLAIRGSLSVEDCVTGGLRTACAKIVHAAMHRNAVVLAIRGSLSVADCVTGAR
jgi:hypothetical protein